MFMLLKFSFCVLPGQKFICDLFCPNSAVGLSRMTGEGFGSSGPVHIFTIAISKVEWDISLEHADLGLSSASEIVHIFVFVDSNHIYSKHYATTLQRSYKRVVQIAPKSFIKSSTAVGLKHRELHYLKWLQ